MHACMHYTSYMCEYSFMTIMATGPTMAMAHWQQQSVVILHSIVMDYVFLDYDNSQWTNYKIILL